LSSSLPLVLKLNLTEVIRKADIMIKAARARNRTRMPANMLKPNRLPGKFLR